MFIMYTLYILVKTTIETNSDSAILLKHWIRSKCKICIPKKEWTCNYNKFKSNKSFFKSCRRLSKVIYFTEVTTSPVKQAGKCGHVQGWPGGENTKTVRYISCLTTKS